MERRKWTREETILAFNLYCKIPFSKINYKLKEIEELAIAINRSPSSIAWKLVNFASLDPTLKARNIQGAKNTSKLDREIFEEFYQNWDNLVYESELKFAEITKNEIEFDDFNFELKEGISRERIVKTRVNQSFFRKMILASYENKCCITDIAISNFLVASHIIPWAKDEKNRLNPENGLCLNIFHDKAFDKGFITIDKDYKVVVSKSVHNLKSENQNLQRFLLDFEGKEIEKPKRFLPNLDFLEYHWKNIFRD